MGKSSNARNRYSRGFTLTELLVAMAIFSILATALVTLFTSAVHSVRTGYASIAAHEQARVAMKTMSRDLTMAFTAREFGDVYNFYGRHDGFMFVGALADGEIGRVTYVFHDELPSKQFESILTLRWGVVVDNVRRQAERIAREYGYSGTDVLNAGVQAQNDLQNALGTHGPNELVEINVRIVPQRLVRYEEPGRGDLDYFNMQVSGVGAPQLLDLPWPYVDPIEPGRDVVPGDIDGSAQLDFLYGGLMSDPGDPTSDLRSMYVDINQDDGAVHPVTLERLYLRVLNRDAFQQFINARKREFWIRMLSGDQTLGVPSLAAENGYWHDEESGDDNRNLRKRVINEYAVADGIIGRALILDGQGNFVNTFDGAEAAEPIATRPLDALDAAVKFSYGTQTRTVWGGDDRRDNDGDSDTDEADEQRYFSEPWSLNYFNTINNLSDPSDPYNQQDGQMDIPDILANGFGVAVPEVDLVYADNELASDMLGNRSSRKNLGSPLLPRLPEAVTMEFWVTRSKRHPNAPDFQRRFSQTVQIPAATGRSAQTTIAQGPGSAL